MPSQNPTIVVVEDDPSMRKAMQRILRLGGFAAALFDSAEEALESDAVTNAECLVLDVRLPGMSGFELYRQLTRSGTGTPAIFITAHDEPAVRAEAESLGASSYLPKPFSGRDLLDAVTRALRRP
jgi:FixJ family two-component response regulator